jgi:glycosyltransferase involved in cell wall biosynthesis
MRIAVDARELRGKPTGVGRFLAAILSEWRALPASAGHEFVELTPHEKSDSGTLWEQMVLPSLVREARADVLFAPGYTGPLLPPVPMVVAIHDVSYAAHPEWFAWREGARRRTLVQLTARAAARVITISQFSKRDIVAHLGIDESKIVVAYPGVSRFQAADSAPSQSVRPAGRSRRVLFVGSIFNRRHVPELIEGFARLASRRDDVHLDIVGDNRTMPHVNLDAIIGATSAADRIHARSYVQDDELRALYGAADAFAFLSEYEGFGLTPLEAIATGVPPLLLDTPVARETCDGAAAYVRHANPAEVEQALDRLLFDATERARVLSAAADVLARYSWADCARRVLATLTEAASV